VNLFGFLAGEEVVHSAEVSTERDVESGLFEDFPLCGLGDCLTWIAFAFGEGDVFVLFSVHQKNPDFAVDDFPTDCSAGDDCVGGATHVEGAPRFLPIISIMVSF
jgi:hypothetical protein